MRDRVAVVIAVLLLSACSTASAGVAHAPGPASGPEASATVLAKQLLGRMPLPAGTQPSDVAVPAGALDPPPVLAAGSVAETRLLEVPGQPAALRSYLLAHTPRGTASSVNLSGNAGPSDVSFDWKAPPAGIEDAELGFEMAADSSSTTLVREYAQVTGFGTRSAAEHLDASGYRSVTVIADIVQPARHVVRTFTNAAVIRRVAGLLNSLPAAASGELPCPGVFDEYSVQFNPVHRNGSVAGVSTYGCFGDQVTVGGAAQPILYDPSYSTGKLEAIVRQLLGITR